MDSQFQFDWQAAINSIPFLIKGIPYTLMISFGGLMIGFALGIIFGLLSINKKWFLRWPATAYIEMGEFEKALPHIQQALEDVEIQSLKNKLMIQRAIAYAGLGNIAKAEQTLLDFIFLKI